MSKFPYDNLSDEEFEDLVIRIVKEILGVGCKTFSIGKDGAKDSWFDGRAEYFPSRAEPWEGKFNIKAKHTKAQNASCSDNEFSVNQTSVLVKEITRLKEVFKTNPFDNYIIFTNRKLSGDAHPRIVKMLQEGLGIQNVDIIGREQIDTYLEDYPHIADKFGLYKFQTPLRFYEKDLRDVIIVFSQQRKKIAVEVHGYLTSFKVIEKKKKNELNNLSKDYFQFIKNHSLQYFEEIDKFLRDPRNEEYMRMYSNTVSDLQEAITVERNRFNEFEHIIKYLTDYTVGNNEIMLKELRRIVRVFIHFMYFNCDIGKTE